MNGPCAKQVVTATLISTDGERFVGTNDCRLPQIVCPRGDLPSGEGYWMCEDICNQTAHAEINAMVMASIKDKCAGSTIYVEGHTYACNSCQAAAQAVNVKEIVIGAPPA